MREARPLPVSLIIGRVIAGVIAARHAREMEGAQPVAAGRALVTENAEPLHALNLSHGGCECPGEITTEIVGAIR